MADFERTKAIDKLTKSSVYGYIRKCQKLFPSKDPYYNLSQLIVVLILLYFDAPDCFEINNSDTFEYSKSKHGLFFHVFGTMKVSRDTHRTYQWKVQISDEFRSRYGLIDITNGTPKVYDKKNMADSDTAKNMVFIGTKKGPYKGGAFGVSKGPLRCFIQPADTVTVTLDFMINQISFTSQKTNKTVTETLRQDVNAMKFIAEFNYCDSTMTLL